MKTMNDYLLEILKKIDAYKETGSESIRQELAELELQTEQYFNDMGQPEMQRGCFLFIHRLLKKVVI